MGLAVGDEDNVLAIWRPLRLHLVTPKLCKLSGGLVPSHGREPQMMLGGPDRPLAIGRNLDVFTIFMLAAHIAKHPSLAALNLGSPDLLLGLLQFTCGIGHMALPADF